MPTFTNETITRLAQEAEQNFAVKYPCIVERLALDIVEDTHTYTLPDYVMDVRRLTWQGFKVLPIPGRKFRETFQGTIYSQTGLPYWYVYNNMGGHNSIRFFPTPSMNIVASQSDLYGAGIRTQVIVEYYRLPDFETKVIPEWFRRRLVKPYVIARCCEIDGQRASLKIATQQMEKFQALSAKYGALLSSMTSTPRRLIVQDPTFVPGRDIASPMLNISKFGTGVWEGD